MIVKDIQVRAAKGKDAAAMAPNLRAADLAELQASLGADADPEAVLKAGIKYSDDPRTVLVDGVPAAIFGVCDTGESEPTVGCIWLMGTDAIETISMAFLRGCKAHLPMQQASYEILTNFVDSRNTVHIRWLQWLGFSIIREENDYGAEKRTFYEFARVSINV